MTSRPDVLEAILRVKQREVAHLVAPDPATLAPSRRDFVAALRPRPDAPRGPVAIIAEVKKASPSAGVLCADFRPADIARDYAAGGAAAISVLTDVEFFQGSLAALSEVVAAVPTPALRKDFIIDERQVHEARAAGADAILLIAALLDEDDLRGLRGAAEALGMAALVEIHDAAEMERAVNSGATLIGINNRNLRDFVIDMEVTLRLAPRLPAGTVIVCESGVETPDDLRRLRGVVDAALIGTSLMKATDRVGLLKSFVAATAGKENPGSSDGRG